MKFPKFLRETMAVLVLLGASTAAHADLIYTFTDADKFFGPAPYGTVKVVQVGTGVEVTVNFNSTLDFINTGSNNQNSHAIFSFNVIGAIASDVTNISFLSTPVGAVVTALYPGGDNKPYQNFTISLDCTTNCSNGGSNGVYQDPLKFTILNTTYNDFLLLQLAANQAYFAADVICVNTTICGNTGTIGAILPPDDTRVPTNGNAPEPASLALMALGLVGIAGASRRRKLVRK